MKQFEIEVISDTPEIIDGIQSHWGRITAGDFTERFVMPLDSWTLDQYTRQWAEGIERIRLHNDSCLVTTVQGLDANALIEMWTLYKEGPTIYIQNVMINRITAKEAHLPDLRGFSSETCYRYIESPRQTVCETGELVSEWSVATKDFFRSGD